MLAAISAAVAIDTSGQSRGDFLQQPAIAVGIAERGIRTVAAAFRIRAAQPDPPKQIRLVRANVHVAAGVKRFADRNAAAEQRVAGGLDVGDDEIQALRGAGRGRGDVLAEDDRGVGAGRGELDHAVIVGTGKIGVEPPAEFCIKLLGAFDIGDRDDDDFELQVDGRRFRGLVGRGCGHGVLPYWIVCDIFVCVL